MMCGDTLAKLTHAQTILETDKLEKLKVKTEEHTTKEAILAAIDHYLECKCTKVKKQ